MHKRPNHWHPSSGGGPSALHNFTEAVKAWERVPTLATLIVLWDACERLTALLPPEEMAVLRQRLLED